MKNNKTIKTWLPLFPGFYNSAFEADDDNIIDYLGVDSWERVDFDNTKYEDLVAKALCEEMESLFPNGMVTKIMYEKVWSPKYYNFRNDSINCTITINTKIVSDYIYKNIGAFSSYVKRKYTSYDGFISSYPNTVIEWEELTKNFMNYEEDAHLLGAVLDFIGGETIDFERVTDKVMEEVHEKIHLFAEKSPLPQEDKAKLVDVAFRLALQGKYFFGEIDIQSEPLDITHGYLALQVAEAKHKAEIFGTDWVNELEYSSKEEALLTEGITEVELEYYKQVW